MKEKQVAIGMWPEIYRRKLRLIVSHKSMINAAREPWTAKRFLCKAVDDEYEKLTKEDEK